METKRNTKTVYVTYFVSARMHGTLEVPANLEDEEEIREYIEDNYDDIDFNEPEVSDVGHDFEFSE